MVLELESLNIETTELQIAVVRLARGVSRKININSRPYHFICPEYEKISIGDWVVVEVKRKTHNKNPPLVVNFILPLEDQFTQNLVLV